ncbi:MAG: KEOPS complex kinase/ATPase Bud32 [Candidatus Diapherotrites archaeon]
MVKEKLIRLGSEAMIFLTSWNGLLAVKKTRLRKKYRHKALDEFLSAKRIKREISLLHRAKLIGVKTPFVFNFIPENREILLERIRGKKAKDCIEKNLVLCKKIARSISLMHNSGIIHGDLTTDNIIVKDGEPYFIDFGLGFYSTKIEDKATDLLNLKRSLLSLKPTLKKEWQTIEESYSNYANGGPLILKKMEDILNRGRYVS